VKDKSLEILRRISHNTLVLVSIIMTVTLFYQISSDTIGRWVYVAFGVGLEFLKLYLLVDSKKKIIYKKIVSGGAIFFVYILLALLSAVASLGYAVNSLENQSFFSVYSNISQDTILSDIQSIDTEIANKIRMQSELPGTWITASQRLGEDIEALRARRIELIGLLELEDDRVLETRDTFTLIGEVFSIDGRMVLLWILTFLILVLELAIMITSEYNGGKKEEDVKQGFFEVEKEKPLPRVKKEPRMGGCESCGMYKLCKNPKIEPKGKGNIMVVFGSPEKQEDRPGKEFMVMHQRYLYAVLESLGVNKNRVTVTHAIQCYQSQVNPKAIEGCHYRLKKRIMEEEPRMVIVCDGLAMRTLYNDVNSGRFSFAKYDKFTGQVIPDQRLKTLVVPIEPPKWAIEALEYRKETILKYKPESTFESELYTDKQLTKNDKFRIFDRFIRTQLRTALKSTWKKTTGKVQTTEDVNEAIKILKYFGGLKECAFDIETTGIKPYETGHEIVTWGFSDYKNAYAFPHFNNKEFLDTLKDVLIGDVGKVGWNIAFEQNWIRELLGYEIKNWVWDGMLASHIIDNRDGITSLKFQAFGLLGIGDYDSDTGVFLKSADSKNQNSINNIKMAPMARLLYYNALDALYTYQIYEIQKKKLDHHIKKGYELFHNGTLSLADMTFHGIRVDMVQLEKNLRIVETKHMEARAEVYKAKEFSKWPAYRNFNVNSPKDLIELFYEILEFPVLVRTDKGEPSTDKNVLRDFYEISGCEIAGKILAYSSFNKIRDSLLGIKREATKDETGEYAIHAHFALNFVSSYRSSSQAPNLQNLAVHDEVSSEMVLGILKPRKDKVIVGADYTSIESFVAACYHHDPTFVKYLMEEGTDAHADTAEDLFLCKKDEVEPDFFKTLRRVGKNANFSILYGVSAGKLASNTWNSMLSREHKDFLKTKGISTFEEWKSHTDAFYKDYWEVKYKDLNDWRNDVWETYIRTGIVNSYTGFKAVNRLTKNFAGNMPSQSAAFHLLLQSINDMKKAMEAKNLEAYFISEIHDSVKIECPEHEVPIVKNMLRRYFILERKKANPWMTLPLKMKGEIYRENLAVEEGEFELTE